LENYRLITEKEKLGNDTFAGAEWSDLFYRNLENEIQKKNDVFQFGNLKNSKPYPDNNIFRSDRHISLKLWLQYMHLI